MTTMNDTTTDLAIPLHVEGYGGALTEITGNVSFKNLETLNFVLTSLRSLGFDVKEFPD